jgi:hypothetical protein
VSFCIRNANESLQIDAEHEAPIALGDGRLKARNMPMSSRDVLRSIELKNRRENELGINWRMDMVSDMRHVLIDS